jgi:hypothetical protein
MTKTCKVCGVTSDAAEFYIGVKSRCKECHKASVRENRAKNADYYREYDAIRFKEDPNVRARHKAYQSTPEGKKAMRDARSRWMNKKPEARAAHIILGNAVRDGKVTKPSSCSKCGLVYRSRCIHAHHDDYTKPIDVIWLCSQCHSDHHK